jgi:hypothetical protein
MKTSQCARRQPNEPEEKQAETTFNYSIVLKLIYIIIYIHSAYVLQKHGAHVFLIQPN